MRVSPLRHNLARLRLFLGKHQEEFADLVGCSRQLIQSVELGRAPLTVNLAERIFLRTWIGADWLYKNDLKAPLVDQINRPYTREAFEKASLGGDQQTDDSRAVNRWSFAQHIFDLFSVYVAAENTSIQATHILGLRFRDFFAELWEEFGLDAATLNDRARLARIEGAMVLTGPVKQAQPV